MIKNLDHIVLVCPEISAAASSYGTLLDRSADWSASSGGVATAIFRVSNTSLELMAPDGEGPAADRLRDILENEGPGLKSLAFGTDEIGNAHHKLSRRGLVPGEITDGSSTNRINGKMRQWRRFRCSDAETAGIKTFLIQPKKALPAKRARKGGVISLDHIVIDTPNPDRALGLYGGRLGLDLALDRTREQWKTRFLFFRTGGLTFEVIHRLGEQHNPSGPDKIWGLTWTVGDLASAHTRLSDAGINVSEQRTGRKPGSAIFTVRGGTLGVPTLFITQTSG